MDSSPFSPERERLELTPLTRSAVENLRGLHDSRDVMRPHETDEVARANDRLARFAGAIADRLINNPDAIGFIILATDVWSQLGVNDGLPHVDLEDAVADVRVLAEMAFPKDFAEEVSRQLDDLQQSMHGRQTEVS